MCLLVILVQALGMLITIEQPDSSVLEYHPRMQEMLSMMPVYKTKFKMFNFGGDTSKGTLLYSNRPWISEVLSFQLNRAGEQQSVKLVNHWTGQGKLKFRGNDKLKGSQAYPVHFGRAMAEVFARHQCDLKASSAQVQDKVAGASWQLDTMRLEATLPPGCGWPDAVLDGVFAFVRGLR